MSAKNTASCSKARGMLPPSMPRSNGDGMEDEQLSSAERKKQIKCSKALPCKTESLASRNSISSCGELPIPIKQKKLKFVPYEPYKAAVTPIVPEQNKLVLKNEKHIHKKTCNSSKVTLKETHIPFPLIFQSPLMHKKSKDNGESVPLLRVLREVSICGDDTNSEDQDETWKKERAAMQGEINKLKEEKKELEDQFTVQLQAAEDDI